MKITHEIYSWLKQNNILSHNYKEVSGKFKISEEDATKLELGLILPLFSSYKIEIPKELKMKKVNNASSRLYNWNILTPLLSNLGLSLDSDVKALIIAGDRKKLCDVLSEIFQVLEKPASSNQINTSEYGSLALSTIEEISDVSETESILEFLIVSCCKCFQLQARISAGLLVQKAEYLTKVMLKGLKGDFGPILDWYDFICLNSEHALYLIEKEQSSINFFLTCLSLGLKSKNNEVKLKSVQTLQEYHEKLKLFDSRCWDWLESQPSIVRECFELVASSENPSNYVILLFTFSKKRLSHIFETKLNDFCGNYYAYLKFIWKILGIISKQPFDQHFYNQGLIDNWVYLAINLAEKEQDNVGNRSFLIHFLSDLWVEFPTFCEIQEESANSILAVMKKAARSSVYLLQIITFGRLFHLLIVLSDKKHSFAPIIYKTLTFALVENYSKPNIREFMLGNLILIYNQFAAIPLGILLEPLIKQSLITKGIVYNLFDFEFYIFISQHQKLSIKDAVLVLDLLSKIFFNDSVYQKLVQVPFLIIVSRFIRLKPIQDYILRFISIALQISFAESEQFKDLSDKHIRKSSLELIEKITDFGDIDFNNQIRVTFEIFVTSSYSKRIMNKKFQSLFYLLGGPLVEEATKSEKPSSIENSGQKNVSWNTIPRGRAMSDIQKVKNKRVQRELKVKELEQKGLSKYLKKKVLRKQIENSSVQNEITSHEAELNLDLCRMSEETKEDIQIISSVFKKYKRVNLFLFKKYSHSTNKTANLNTFEKIRVDKEYLSESGFSKMVRENNIPKSMILTEEVKKIYRFLLSKIKGLFIPYDYFLELLFILSSVIFTRNNYNFSRYPPAYYLQSLYTTLEQSSEMIPKHYFEESDPGYGDRDVIRALNYQLSQNSEVLLPQGYKKVLEPVLELEYSAFGFPKSSQICLELLEEIMFNALNFHLLMPVILIKFVPRAKGILQYSEAKSVSVKYLQKAESSFHFTKLSPNMKVHALSLSSTPQDIAIACANVLDDIIFTIEKQSPVLISKVPKPVKLLTNKVIEEREQKLIDEELIERKRENKRKNREKETHEKLDRLRQQAEYNTYLEKIEKQKKAEKDNQIERLKKEKKDRENFELNEKLINYKLEKIEKQKKLEEMKREQSEGRTILKKGYQIHKITNSLDFSRENYLDKNIVSKRELKNKTPKPPKLLSKLN